MTPWRKPACNDVCVLQPEQNVLQPGSTRSTQLSGTASSPNLIYKCSPKKLSKLWVFTHVGTLEGFLDIQTSVTHLASRIFQLLSCTKIPDFQGRLICYENDGPKTSGQHRPVSKREKKKTDLLKGRYFLLVSLWSQFEKGNSCDFSQKKTSEISCFPAPWPFVVELFESWALEANLFTIQKLTKRSLFIKLKSTKRCTKLWVALFLCLPSKKWSHIPFKGRGWKMILISHKEKYVSFQEGNYPPICPDRFNLHSPF